MDRARTLAILLLAAALTGACDLVGDILEFGFWMAVIVAVLIVAAIWALVRALFGRRRREP